jgi:hypothetical protein
VDRLLNLGADETQGERHAGLRVDMAILLDLNEEQVYVKTVLIPPELIPAATPTSGAY